MNESTTVEEVWHAVELDEVFKRLATSKTGLNTNEAQERLLTYGRNELTQEESVSFWQALSGQFASIVIWLLIVAAAIAAVMGEWIDSTAIVVIVLINALLGAYQEHSAEQAILALKRLTIPRARVRRNGVSEMISGPEIVPGDLLELEAGDLVPADARLLEEFSLRCVESALTGESEPIDKQVGTLTQGAPLAERSNMIFMGTAIASGAAKAIVVGTGFSTQVGHIAALLKKTERQRTPLQDNLETLGKRLVFAALAIVAFLFIVGLIRRLPLSELLLTSISLAVAAVPEGLPAVLTIALGLGVRRMASRRALIRKLPAVETLGSTNVICTDKTGTLTVGQMTAREVYVAGSSYLISGEGYCPRGEVSSSETLSFAVKTLGTAISTCNSAAVVEEKGEWKALGDPTEAALLVAAQKLGIGTKRQIAADYPFDSDRKRRTVVVRTEGESIAYTNGAPEVLLPLCTCQLLGNGDSAELDDSSRKSLEKANYELAAKGYRVIATAFRKLGSLENLGLSDVESNLVFIGFTAIVDPPRSEAKKAVSKCHEAGINVVMITGDQPRTALAIAQELGIANSDSKALTGAELELMSDEQLQDRVVTTNVFARVTAAHKLRIVKAWQVNDATVAMTGDGVNDAPALQGADVGIAMGKGGTEVAKQAAAMVITDDNFATIVAAVEEGRGVYQNIRKTIQYLLAGNAGELLFITACLVVGLPMPLLPIHLLWINLVTDGLPALCLASDPISPGIMRAQPRNRTQGLADKSFMGGIALTGALTASVTMVAYLYGLFLVNEMTATTYAFATLVFAELLRSFGARSETESIIKVGLHTNFRLVVVVAIGIFIQLASHHSEVLSSVFRTQTVGLRECVALLLLGSLPLVVTELIKGRSRTTSAKE
ncbi:MAG: cation-translocating P-type ATPase [Deltaproteobacteria bacterium]|nr:cation-translocating P-type ATPase [Deltaproteobacteria bacterium]